MLSLPVFGLALSIQDVGPVIGTVTNERGETISGATVTITNGETGDLVATLITDSAGHYQFSQLDQGIYRMKAEKEGFDHAQAFPVVLLTAGALRVDLVLKVRNLIQEFMEIAGPTYPSDLKDRTEAGHATLGATLPPVGPLDDMQQLTKDGILSLAFEEVAVISEKTHCGGPSKDHILESGGAGVALLDYDGDGMLDIFLVNAFELTADRRKIPHANLLYRNLGDWKFKNVSREAGIDNASWGMGVCAGDYNDDGYLDLYVTNFGPNFLYRNNGDGTFTEVAQQAGVGHPGWSTGCAFLDADGDQDLDLYLANYIDCSWDDVVHAQRIYIWRGGPKVMVGPVGLKPAPDVFYRNEGSGRFVDNTAASGFETEEAGYGFGVLATDYDGDGALDLYVANDSTNNFLFHNRGGGQFDEVGLESGTAFSGDGRVQAGMGVDSADVDSDGFVDLVVTNFARDTNTLYRNVRGRWFEDASEIFGLKARTFERLGWGVVFFDADLDGDVDLFTANGHLYPQVDDYPELNESFRQKNQILLNENGTFLDFSEAAGSGLQVRKSSRGTGVGDLDNNGRLDLVVTNMDESPTVLRNLYSGDHHWVSLDLRRNSGKNRFCIGSRVVITAGSRKQIREVRSGGSYLSQGDLRLHFGLGSHGAPIDVEIQLPGVGKWRFEQVPVDQSTSLTLSDDTLINR